MVEQEKSRYDAATKSLAGATQEGPRREARTDIALQKSDFEKLIRNEWRAYIVKNPDLMLGDTLHFRELDGFNQTGQFQVRTVSYIQKSDGLRDGYVLAGWEVY